MDDLSQRKLTVYEIGASPGRRGFLKAMDYSRALTAPNRAQELRALADEYLYEKLLLDQCKEKRLSRIVVAIAEGNYAVFEGDPYSIVDYLVFELAERDIRAQIDIAKRLDVVWSFRVLHQVATGLTQLHGIEIAHQDLKPSNVLMFPDKCSKLADLGHASHKSIASPRAMRNKIPGDPGYTPPEFLYGETPTEWGPGKVGCDAYLLGSMVVFMFSRVGLTGALLAKLDQSLHPKRWAGTFQEVLPYLREAFERSIAELGDTLEDSTRPAVLRIVRELCDPDPALRGHPGTSGRPGNRFAIDRYVSEFDYLASRAELEAAKRRT